jgi:hypothetical protein
MNNNIYLELELSLDPAITDAAALKIHLEQKISEWNKNINASPKFKVKVTKAKEYIKNGLVNLPKQADEARNKMLQKLCADIFELKLLGEIDDIGFKHLKNTFKNYFNDNTIRQEIGGAQFLVPVCPTLLQCDKPISFNDMQTILDDLKIVENGKYQNLYDLLGLSPSTDVKILYDKSKEESNRIVKIMTKTPEVDALNRLSGKAINFFKDKKSKDSYDKSLKRLPFDKLCDEKFKLRAIKKEITWKIYQMSIQETLVIGFTQDEAEWLVYEFYCITKKCPPPKPEPEQEQKTIILTQNPVSVPPINNSTENIQIGGKSNFWNNIVKKSKYIGNNIKNNATEFIQQIKTFQKQQQPYIHHKNETTFSPDIDSIVNDFYTVRKRYQSNKSHSDTVLHAMFDSLDSLVTQQQVKPTELLPEMLELRAKIAKEIGDIEYNSEHFDFSLRYYNAVLEYDPRDKIAQARKKTIDHIKTDLFLNIETLLSEGDIIKVNPFIEELKLKFETDFETIDFLRKLEDRIKNPKPSIEQLQKLINEKKYQTILHLLESQPNIEPLYQDVLKKTKRRMEQVLKAEMEIRNNIQQGKLKDAEQLLIKLSDFVSDYTEIKSLQEEIELKKNHVSEYGNEIKSLCEQKRWIRAENIVRKFLKEHPVPNIKLGSLVQNITAGVVRYENKLRFLLFSVFGGLMFLVFSYFLFHQFTNFDGDKKFGIVLFFGLELAVAFTGLGVLLRFLFSFTRKKSETSNAMSLASIIPWGIFVAVAVSCCGIMLEYQPYIVSKLEHSLQQENKQLTDVLPLYYGVYYVLPALIQAFAIGWFQAYLYLFFQCCINNEKRIPSIHLLWLCIILSIWFLFISSPKFQESLGSLAALLAHPFTTLSLIWITVCLLAWCDNKNDLNTSFGLSDFKDFLERGFLLSKFRTNEFGKPSLMVTDWYKDCEKLQQQQTAQTVKTTAQQVPSPLPSSPKITPKIPVPQPVTQSLPPVPVGVRKVPVPPLQNQPEQKR